MSRPRRSPRLFAALRAGFLLPAVLLIAAGFRPDAHAQTLPVAADTTGLAVPSANGEATYQILGISVEGASSVAEGQIISVSGLRQNERITLPGPDIPTAIRRLWKQALFSDVDILVDQQLGTGVYLVIRVAEYPRLDKVLYRGNHKIKGDDLEKKSLLLPGQVLSPQSIRTAELLIKKVYEEKGYLNVQVTATTERTTPTRTRLTLTVDEGKQVQIAAITFTGNTAFSDKKLRGQLKKTKQDAWYRFWSSAKFKRNEYEEDKQHLLDFYRNHGYRDAEIVSDSMTFSPDRRRMSLDLTVNEGPQYHIRRVEWEGNTLFSDSLLTLRLDMAPGDVFDAGKLGENLRGNAKQSDIGSLYYDSGYLTFGVNPEEIVVPGDSLDLVMRVNEGSLFHIRNVLITGNDKTSEAVIRRELRTLPGDTFSKDAIVRSQRELATLNFFDPQTIGIDPQIVTDKAVPDQVDILYSVKEKSTDTFNASVGYSGGNIGFTGSVGVSFNNFSLQNALAGRLPMGDGQRLALDTQFGKQASYTTVSLSFAEPWFRGRPTSLGVNLYYTRDAINSFLNRVGAVGSIGRRLRFPDDYFRGDWSVQIQSNSPISPRTTFEQNRYDSYKSLYGSNFSLANNKFSVTQTITRNSVDQPLFPRRGALFQATIELAYGPTPKSPQDRPWSQFDKWDFTAGWNTPLIGSLILSPKIEFGSLGLLGHGKESYLSYYDLYRIGGAGLNNRGATPLRGYDDNVANYTDGRVLTKTSAELRYPLTLSPQASIWVLGFAEAGNTWNQLRQADLFGLRRSAGVGVRVMLPRLGVLGIDYAYGFDQFPDPRLGQQVLSPTTLKPSGWHLHFVFGQGAQ